MAGYANGEGLIAAVRDADPVGILAHGPDR